MENKNKAAAGTPAAASNKVVAENTSAKNVSQNAMRQFNVKGAEQIKSDDELLARANENATPEGAVLGDGPQQKEDRSEKAPVLVNALDAKEVAADANPGKGDVSKENTDATTTADKSVGTNGQLVNALSPEEVAGVAAPGSTDVETSEKTIEALQNVEGPFTGLVDANHPDKNWKKTAAKAGKTKNIRFLLSPTGRFGLGYSVGDEAPIETKQAAELVDAGYARYVNDDKA